MSEDKDKITEVSVDVTARILATFYSYFSINLEALSRFLILYH